MSGPAGAGRPMGDGLAGLVHHMAVKHKEGDLDMRAQPDDMHPSKGLPATGLKRNTQEWRDNHEDEDGKDKGRRPNGGRRRHSSSSSIPSNATGSDDERRRTGSGNGEGQEGAAGRGPGRHEEDLVPNGYGGGGEGQYTDSPLEELPSIPLPSAQLPPDQWAEPEPVTSPKGVRSIPAVARRASRMGDGGEDSDRDTEEEEEEEEELDGRDGSNRADSNGHNGIDKEEMIESRDSKRNRTLTDERGRYPDGLPGVKEEIAPGPQNDIILEPRITHMNYHQVREDTVKGVLKGPILKVTGDGEKELPPGETPRPSRQPSNQSGSSRPRSDRQVESQADEDEFDEHLTPNYFDHGKALQEHGGHWTTAMNHTARPRHRARFSSFRTEGETRPRSFSSGAGSLSNGNTGRHSFYSMRSGHSRGQSDREDHEDHGVSGDNRDRDGEHGDSQDTSEETEESRAAAQKRWSLLRSRVLPSRHHSSGIGPSQSTGPGAATVSALSSTAIASVPITTELLAGQLPVMILKTWLDRDEDGNRAVPVLLGNMRFRVGDSVGLREGSASGREMFKVECEYGDGVVKWVIYRELRDFLSLHAHYKAANFGTSVGGLRGSRRVDIPEFPKMSIPYLNKVQRTPNGKEKSRSKAEFAQASRDALQQYLVDLIRAVIFRPESNRLCKFFELSSLTLSLAPRGGFQGKAGFLKLPGANTSRRANQPGLTPTSWVHHRSPKWFVVRDSYFVATEGPEATEFYDVFLIDQDFAIERPKRAYRTGFHFISGKKSLRAHKDGGDTVANAVTPGHENEIDVDNPLTREMIIAGGEGKGDSADQMHDENEHHASQHTFFIVNSQRKIKLVARNARQMHQFIVSMERIAAQSAWTGRNRFDSFAPLRVNVAAQWLVDGRDYFWNLSRAINMAKDRIYIHDWWISPELYLRRPGDERYRLDNLLKRKAEDGVKIFIIIYNEVSDKTTPVDSPYTKRTLQALHPNIMVQRSPSHFQTGTFYWSHHEKMCVVDETIAFMGGLDLCYGRWDTPQHVLTDEDHTQPDGPDGPIWRGKDYSNERVMEYSNLDKPFEDMFDRSKVPRMPWHDVGMQIVGQPARDICRHFVQRWNLLIRTKNHKRRLPFLLPAADFTDRELHDLQLQGTCEVQICRSVGPWSMGTLTKIEHSVQNAYVKSIELSEHFVYIENQFFITSTVVDGITIQNQIGDALVERIIRAYKEGTKWRACIVIPLLPGYTYPIDSGEASSVRLILECQNRTISRGKNSIFSRLTKEGIDPDEYITFFSLRGWAKFKSGTLTTEQVYIHGKTCVIDDRLVLCGSANINERSQRGDRDSELLSVIRDTDMIDGTMGGKPFKVGRFAHTLRVRLMREHVGVDVDSIEEDQLMSRKPVADADEIETWDPDHEQEEEGEGGNRGITQIKRRGVRDRAMTQAKTALGQVTKGMSENAISNVRKAADKVVHPVAVLVQGNTIAHHTADDGDPAEREDYGPGGRIERGFAGSLVPTLEEKTIFERRPDAQHANGKPLFDLIEEGEVSSPTSPNAADGDRPPSSDGQNGMKEATVPRSTKEEHDFVDANADESKSGVPKVQGDPEDTEFFGAPANAHERDDKPPTKDRLQDGDGHGEDGRHDDNRHVTKDQEMAVQARKTLRKHLNAKIGVSPWTMPTPTPKINPNRFHDPLDDRFWKDMWVAVAVHNTEIFRKVFRCIPDDLVTTWAQYKAFANHAEKFNRTPEDVAAPGSHEPPKVVHEGPGTQASGGGGDGGAAIGQGHGKDGHVEHDSASPKSTGSPLEPSKSHVRGADVVNGVPRDYGRMREGLHLATGKKDKDASNTKSPSSPTMKLFDRGKASSPSSPYPNNNAGGKSPGASSTQTFASTGSGEKEKEKKHSGPEDAWHDWEVEEMEELLKEVRGHLVIYPTRFLEAEDLANNFLFNSDKILPLPIYD